MTVVDIHDFARSVVDEVVSTAAADVLTVHDAFAERVLSELELTGHLDEWSVCYYRTRGVEVSGFGWNDALSSLDLFVVHFREQPLLAKMGIQDLRAAAKRAIGFVDRVEHGLRAQLDPLSEVHDMCQVVEDRIDKAEIIRVFILTNDATTTSSLPESATSNGVTVKFEIWDITRLHRLSTSGVLHEPIVVEFDDPLPCLSTPTTDENYSVLLAIIRGDVLGAMYEEYGTRLLELNVRSFLQLKGAVNRGIRETLIHAPERFLAYNNGISATASKVVLAKSPGGGTGISQVHDLQIVNGGQTTASIHNALKRQEGRLSDVFVQMKLTVVEPDHLAEIVPEISRFSNTQNKVTVVDFSSNDPYHVELEKVTRTLWAPAVEGTGQETKWFFERARGQYADALNRAGTLAKQNAFKRQYPVSQKFVKTDVAKWEHSWALKPWLVSRGAEKNFRAFMMETAGKVPTREVDFVKTLIAKGILFRITEKIVSAQQFGGYRANIVTYTIAKLSYATAQRIDLDRIWREQAVSDATRAALVEVSRIVHEIIISPPAGMSHVGEWTKKEACWGRVLEAEWTAPPALERELLELGRAKALARSNASAGLAAEQVEEIAVVERIDADTWFSISNWAKETGNLQPWQRSLAFSLGRLKARTVSPSVKQAHQGKIILETARNLGFQC